MKFYENLLFYLSKIIKKSQIPSVSNSKIDIYAKIHAGSSVVSSSIGRYSYCGYDCTIINADIGSFCSIASNVSIGGAAHPMHFVSTSPAFLSHKDSVGKKFSKFDYLPVLRTIIGNDVWIGGGVFVKAGINIGHGAVIGMGAVVTKDVPPYSIVVGNPARVIRFRFSDEIIQGLLGLNWWDLTDDEIEGVAEYFNDPLRLLINKGIICE